MRPVVVVVGDLKLCDKVAMARALGERGFQVVTVDPKALEAASVRDVPGFFDLLARAVEARSAA